MRRKASPNTLLSGELQRLAQIFSRRFCGIAGTEEAIKHIILERDGGMFPDNGLRVFFDQITYSVRLRMPLSAAAFSAAIFTDSSILVSIRAVVMVFTSLNFQVSGCWAYIVSQILFAKALPAPCPFLAATAFFTGTTL